MQSTQSITAKSRGSKEYGELGESWVEWYHFTRVLSEAEAEQFCEAHGLGASYGGTGLSFTRRPVVRRSRSHTLILHSGGLDI